MNGLDGKPLPIIRFSHDYQKLPLNANGKMVILKYATHILLQYQTETFIIYDTTFRNGKGHYPLPRQGDFILLLFEMNMDGVFTTLRRWTPEKYKYYKSMVGKPFEVAINE